MVELSTEDGSLGGLDTIVVAGVDALGRLFGKRLTATAFAAGRDSGFAACSTNLTWGPDLVPVEGLELGGAHNGYPNFLLLPRSDAIFPLGQHERTALVLCDVATETREPVEVSPRWLLDRQVLELAKLGLSARVAVELEFVLYRGRDWRRGPILGGPANYSVLAGSAIESVLGPLRRHLAEAGLEVEAAVPEGGRGQVECTLTAGEPLAVADRAAVFKEIVKEVALEHGLSASFMAKPFSNDAGSSGHLHLSLWREGVNVMALDSRTMGEPGRRALAGLLALAPVAMPFYAPNVNSYKRLRPGSFAPVRANWGVDNRTVAVRALPGPGPAARIELRVPGADASAHLALALALASARHGIQAGLSPPDATAGDGSAPEAEGESLPARLDLAIDRARGSGELRNLVGAKAVDHYLHLANAELEAQAGDVSEWDRERYWDAV